METRFTLALCFAVLVGLQAWSAAPAAAADCGQGSNEERIACLATAVTELEAKLAKIAEFVQKDTLKWNDRIALMNEDMRIFPRCLDNPGPNSRNISDVLVTSCSNVPAQTWMIRKPYRFKKKAN